MRLIDGDERRARLARRHAVSAQYRVGDAEAATRTMTVLHATEHPTPYLSVQARVDSFVRDDLDRLLHQERTLVKQLAMRRTLFVFPVDLLPAAWGSASRRVATQIGARLIKEVEQHGVADDGAAWVAAASTAVLELLADGGAMSASQLREALPELEGRIEIAAGKKYSGRFPVAPRVLAQLGVEGRLVRGGNGGHWRISKPMWTRMDSWLADVPEPLPADEGYAELIGRYLRTFGPATEADIVWWFGATKSSVRAALSTLEAAEVALEGDRIGYVLPDDVEPEPEVEPWAALLPVLDPTTMGWKERDFYLDPEDVRYLFDTNGNGGTTAWWNGRIVGAYVQDDAGRVELVLHHDPGAAGRRALQEQADRLTDWLEGEVVTSVYKSHLMRGEPLP